MNKELEKALGELKQIETDNGTIRFSDFINVDKDEPVEKVVEVIGVVEDDKIDANAIVTITKRNMLARIRLTPPINGGKHITKEVIEKSLKEKGVIQGINENYIERLVNSHLYDKSIIIAKGFEAIRGEDEFVEFLIEQKSKLKPLIFEDGHVDYKNLSFGNSVDKDTVLALVYPPTMGIDGYDVFGNIVSAVPGKFLKSSPAGVGTYVADDNCTILSSIGGNVSFKKGKIKVLKELVVQNVDLSTGNIVFSGDVKVKGDVLEGFEIKCQGDIKVAGVIENATLISGGDIIVAKGIHGEHSKIFAEGGVRSGYIEFATVNCRDSIFADYILNANVLSGDKVIIEGEHGYCVGGSCVATNGIEVNILGNEANMSTKIQLIETDTISEEIAQLNQKIENYTSEISKLTTAWQNLSKQPLSIKEKEEKSKKITEIKKVSIHEMHELQIQLDKLEIENNNKHDCVIWIKEQIFPNVHIKINDLEVKNEIIRTNCTILNLNDEIVYSDIVN